MLGGFRLLKASDFGLGWLCCLGIVRDWGLGLGALGCRSSRILETKVPSTSAQATLAETRVTCHALRLS